MLYLVRHGQTDWNTFPGKFQGQKDVPLNLKGREQARKLAEYFRWKHLDKIYASTLTRTIQTARPIAEEKGVPIIEEPWLKEQSLGDWEGKRFHEIAFLQPGDLTRWIRSPRTASPPPGGETFELFSRRVSSCFQRIVAENENQDILIVAHAGTIKVILCQIRKLDLSLVNTFHIRNGDVIAVG